MELSLSDPIFHELLKEVKILRENYFYKMVILVKWHDVLKNAMDDVGCRMLAIPACLLYLNPIENMFHLVRENLQKDALTKEIKKDIRNCQYPCQLVRQQQFWQHLEKCP